MKSLLRYTFSLLFFWLLVFGVHRIFFMLYQWPIDKKITNASDLPLAFVKGYQLDLATGTMLLLLPLLLAVLFYIIKLPVVKRMALVVTTFFLLVYTLTAIGDAGLYREWNAKMNMQALAHFKNPAEVLHILSIPLIILFFALVFFFFFPFYMLYRKKLHALIQHGETIPMKKRILMGTLYLLLSVGTGIITIRGGLSEVPISQSVAYFSRDVLANDIAVNPLYNLLQDATIQTKIPDSTVWKFRTHEEALAIVNDDFQTQSDSNIKIVNTTRPNMVFIFLEGWSADNIHVLGGLEGCTPSFNELCREGLLFPRAYSNAYVSDQGVPCGLSAYPSVSRVAVVNIPSRVPGMPCISEELKSAGYSTSFMYGSDLTFGNLRGYLLEKQFDEIIEQKDLSRHPAGRLGVHDEYTFQELLQNLSRKKQPFFQGFFTLSSHMPYDFPPADNWKAPKDDIEKQYTEAMHYADIQLGKFFEEAKKESWYANTLFVLVADHSHNTTKQWSPAQPEHSHIPLLITGGALKQEWKGQKWNKIVSQLDIASTVLHQLEIPATRYTWSRNMFNPSTPSSAYYIFYGGQGYINEEGYAASHQGASISIHSNVQDSLIIHRLHDKAMSFQQLVYETISEKP